MEPIAPTRQRTKHQNTNVFSSDRVWSSDEDALLESLVLKFSPPEWDRIRAFFPYKTTQQIIDRWKKVLDPGLKKGAWTREEDEIIMRWVQNNGPRNWGILAGQLPGRISKQCRERYVNSLDPNVDRTPWTQEDDDLLIKYHELLGNKWAQIAAHIKGRTDNAVKNRWNSSLKKKLERAQKGEDIIKKRGRKPKNSSERTASLDNSIPKPDIPTMELSVQGTKKNGLIDSPLFSAIQFTPILTNEPSGMSPAFLSPLKGTSLLSSTFLFGHPSPTLISNSSVPSVEFDANVPAPEL